MEERILNKARELFYSCGIRSVTMDDIARQTGMSKKTIYQFYSDKNEIVEKVISNLLTSHGLKIKGFCEEAENAIHEVVLQSQSIAEIFQSLKPGFFFEVQKHFPATWKLVDGHRNECVLQGITNNLSRGIEEGLYRPELQVKTIAHIRQVQLRSVQNLQNFPADQFTYQTLLKQLTELFLYGISSPTGQQQISKYIKLNN